MADFGGQKGQNSVFKPGQGPEIYLESWRRGERAVVFIEEEEDSGSCRRRRRGFLVVFHKRIGIDNILWWRIIKLSHKHEFCQNKSGRNDMKWVDNN